MQMVSAVKMRKAQQSEIESRPYRAGITSLIKKLSSDLAGKEMNILGVDTSLATRNLTILVTSNKGLAGAFNMNILRYMISHDLLRADTDYIVIGHKGAQALSRMKDIHIIANFTHANPTMEATAIFDLAMKQYRSGSYKQVLIVYNKFISSVRSEVACEKILPLASLRYDASVRPVPEADKPSNLNTEHTIEPSSQKLIEQLVLSYLEQMVRGALISSEAVEHSARMMAMKSATDNATSLMNEMTLLANRLRQEKITYELLDMITAKESVG